MSASATEIWNNTANGSQLQFETTLNGTLNRDTRMIIANDGNVHIGGGNVPFVSGAARSLTVASFPSTGSSPSGDQPASLELQGGSSNSGGVQSKIDFISRTSVPSDVNTARIEVTNTANTGQGKMLFYTRGASGLSEKMRIEAGGNVGIGVANPTQKLDVDGSISYTGAIMPNGIAGTNGYLLTSTGGGTNTWTDPASLVSTSAWSLSGNGATNPSTQYLGTSDPTDLVFRTDAIERMRLSATGKLGIGTNNPQTSLHVSSDADPGIAVMGATSKEPGMMVLRSNGTLTTPSAPIGGMTIGYFGLSGYNVTTDLHGLRMVLTLVWKALHLRCILYQAWELNLNS
jgi:hypothetical protein